MSLVQRVRRQHVFTMGDGIRGGMYIAGSFELIRCVSAETHDLDGTVDAANGFRSASKNMSVACLTAQKTTLRGER